MRGGGTVATSARHSTYVGHPAVSIRVGVSQGKARRILRCRRAFFVAHLECPSTVGEMRAQYRCRRKRDGDFLALMMATGT